MRWHKGINNASGWKTSSTCDAKAATTKETRTRWPVNVTAKEDFPFLYIHIECLYLTKTRRWEERISAACVTQGVNFIFCVALCRGGFYGSIKSSPLFEGEERGGFIVIGNQHCKSARGIQFPAHPLELLFLRSFWMANRLESRAPA